MNDLLVYIIRGIVAVLMLAVMVCMLSSCNVQQAIPTSHQRDSVRVEYRLDSIYLYERDSIYVEKEHKNDTILLTTTKWSVRYKDVLREVHDTIAVNTTDTIVQQVKYVPAYYKRVSRGFWMLLVILLAIVGVWGVKMYYKIQKGGVL